MHIQIFPTLQRDYDDFDAGESYLELSNTEEAMLDKVCSEFSKVIVVINAKQPNGT